MIERINSINQLDIYKLFDLYKDDIERDRMHYFSNMDSVEGRLCVENNLYIYLRDVFFRESKGVIYILSDPDRYISAVRFENYKDGLLLNALVTQYEHRKNGYASMLLQEALSDVKNTVYSHIHCKNQASIAIHRKFGFEKFLDYAILLDGSVCTDHFTYIRNI